MLHAAPYYGGKAAGNQLSNAGRWLAAHLPIRDIYVEPFCGMCGVLLQRNPSRCEIVNDADSRITNWWRCIRDSPAEFRHLLDHSPRSDFDFAWARKVVESAALPDLSDPSNKHDLRVGIATHIVLADSMFHCLGAAGSRMAVPYGYGRGRGPTDIERLATRMRKVHLVNRDALEVLDKMARHANTVIYVDPPYRDADTRPYAVNSVDRDALTDILHRQQGMVVISGYGDEWDGLGWPSVSLPAKVANAREGTAPRRTETIWSNQPLRQSIFRGQ